MDVRTMSLSGRCPLNLLLIGPADGAEEFLVPLVPSLASPIVYLNGTEPELPTRAVGTMIVRALAQMTPSSQTSLLEWLSNQGVPPRVIATSPRSLFTRVRRQ